MSKRTVSLLLWFYAGWTFGGLIAFVTGATDLIGPVIGFVVAAVVWLSPRISVAHATERVVRA